MGSPAAERGEGCISGSVGDGAACKLMMMMIVFRAAWSR